MEINSEEAMGEDADTSFPGTRLKAFSPRACTAEMDSRCCDHLAGRCFLGAPFLVGAGFVLVALFVAVTLPGE